MRLNLKSFEACIEKIADGMALDEALELIARGDPIASRKRAAHKAMLFRVLAEAGAVDPDN